MTLLAPDPAVPHRDTLLEAEAVARLLAADGCERVHAKYRVGHSLRVVYRVRRGRRHEYVAARTFARGTSRDAFDRAGGEAAAGAETASPPVVHLPEVDAVMWRFPHDRRLAALPLLAGPSAALDRLVGEPVGATRLVAYAAERSASAACLGSGGRVVAYATVRSGGTAAERRALEAAALDPSVHVPPVLGATHDDAAIAVGDVPGRPLDPHDPRALRRLGAALAALHRVRPLPATRFERLDADRLATAAAVIGRVRPGDEAAAQRLVEALLSRPPDAAPAVHLHGDANRRNAIADNGRVALIDLEHAAAGPAAADLGQVLATLLLARTEADALLDGYADPPDPYSLRWFTAASVLARCALPAVSRVRPPVLRRLAPTLDAALRLL